MACKGIVFYLTHVLSENLQPAYFKRWSWDSYRKSLLIPCFCLPFPSLPSFFLPPLFFSFLYSTLISSSLFLPLPLFFLSILWIKSLASCTMGLYYRATPNPTFIFFLVLSFKTMTTFHVKENKLYLKREKLYALI